MLKKTLTKIVQKQGNNYAKKHRQAHGSGCSLPLKSIPTPQVNMSGTHVTSSLIHNLLVK